MNINKHCHHIYSCITEGEAYKKIGWHPLARWLRTAAGLKNVDFSLHEFEDSACGCINAMWYNSQMESFAKDSTLFLLVWSAIEALHELIKPTPFSPKHQGKINKICWFITDNYPKNRILSEYIYSLDRYCHYYRERTGYDPSIEYLSNTPHININSMGLFLAYKMRNKLAHGDDVISKSILVFDQFDIRSSEIFHGTNLALHSIRMALFSWLERAGVDGRSLLSIEKNTQPEYDLPLLRWMNRWME